MADRKTRTRKPKASEATTYAPPAEVTLPSAETEKDARLALNASIPGWAELTEAQQSELAEMVLTQRKQPVPVKVKITRKPEGGMTISIPGECEAHGVLKLQKTFAAVTMDPVNARANELLNYLGSVNADNTDRYNAALSFVESMEPQNQAEALLLVQMYATHDAAMRSLNQLGKAEWMPTLQTFGNLANKLLRTYQGQMETLARTRRGGEQVVRHVHVDNRGGQAVIAETVQTGGQNAKSIDQSHAIEAAGFGAALPGADPLGWGMPSPSGEGPEAVPDARRHKSRSA
jgi:hypothetical protein